MQLNVAFIHTILTELLSMGRYIAVLISDVYDVKRKYVTYYVRVQDR